MTNAEIEQTVERLLEKDCYVIDFLPVRVPVNSDGRFFAVEEYYLETRGRELRRSFSEILLKLYCFYDFIICTGEECRCENNPPPEKLDNLVLENRGLLNILIEKENTLISVDGESTYITVYNPSKDIIEKLEPLVAANGLFLRRGVH